jgi:hypothetical protein
VPGISDSLYMYCAREYMSMIRVIYCTCFFLLPSLCMYYTQHRCPIEITLVPTYMTRYFRRRGELFRVRVRVTNYTLAYLRTSYRLLCSTRVKRSIDGCKYLNLFRRPILRRTRLKYFLASFRFVLFQTSEVVYLHAFKYSRCRRY